MKIVFVLKSFAIKAGTERVMSDKMNYLAEHGYDVTLVTYEQGIHPLAFSLHPTILHFDLDTRFFLFEKNGIFKRFFIMLKMRRLFRRRLQSLLDEIHPDILVTTTYSMKLVDIILSVKTSACRLVESHVACYTVKKSFDYKDKSLFRLLAVFSDIFMLRKIAKADYLVTLTHGDAADWRRYTPNVIVIPNPVTYIPETIVPCDVSRHRIICVGRLHEQKGFDMLIDAFAMIAYQCPEWTVDIFGEGSDREVLEERILRNTLEGRIKINGSTSYIYDEYQRSDFFVLSSRYEGFGLVLVEAMSCGIPCVSFRCKYGPEEIITSGEDGLLVDDGNVQALADSMLWMMEHSLERKEMGKNARINVAKYKKDFIMRSWMSLFNELYNSNYGKLV